MSQKIVLTGATGLIGPCLFHKLIEQGNHVTVLAREAGHAEKIIPGAARYVHWETNQTDGDWVNTLDGADAVIHLAGIPVAERWTDDHKKAIYDSRVTGTRNIVAAIGKVKNKPKTFISASAIGYYGIQSHSPDVPALTEKTPAGSDFLAQVCIDWEAEARKAEAYGTRVALIRTGIVLSLKGGALGKMLMPYKFFVGGPIGSGKQWVSWIHIDDESEIFLFALSNPNAKGPINAVAPTPVTMDTLAHTFGKAMGRPSLFPVPMFVLHALLGDAAGVVGEGQRVIPEKLLALGFKFKFPELGMAVEDLLTHNK
ncbi:MAG: TIGR01777 family protein [Chlorobiales bacterium]|nr:TIGR01777 family protein [Chlorobiales bacterium]